MTHALWPLSRNWCFATLTKRWVVEKPLPLHRRFFSQLFEKFTSSLTTRGGWFASDLRDPKLEEDFRDPHRSKQKFRGNTNQNWSPCIWEIHGLIHGWFFSIVALVFLGVQLNPFLLVGIFLDPKNHTTPPSTSPQLRYHWKTNFQLLSITLTDVNPVIFMQSLWGKFSDWKILRMIFWAIYFHKSLTWMI